MVFILTIPTPVLQFTCQVSLYVLAVLNNRGLNTVYGDGFIVLATAIFRILSLSTIATRRKSVVIVIKNDGPITICTAISSISGFFSYAWHWCAPLFLWLMIESHPLVLEQMDSEFSYFLSGTGKRTFKGTKVLIGFFIGWPLTLLILFLIHKYKVCKNTRNLQDY